MKFQLSILLILALFICDLVVSAESEKTSKIVGRKKFNRRPNKAIIKPDDAQKGENRSRFPRSNNHGNGGYRTTNRPGTGMARTGTIGK